MFRKASIIVCLMGLLSMVSIRVLNTDRTTKTWVNVISWDALAYYMYIPGTFIYHDMKALAWFKTIDSVYHPTPTFYQAHLQENGNYVMKYYMGTAILCSPFVFVAHQLCPLFDYPQDGFSVPYHIAICVAAIVYAFLALLLLRKVLLVYYSEKVTAISLLLMVLGTNYLQYTGVDSGMTHVYLFFVGAVLLYVTQQWYLQPKKHWAFLIGYSIGFAVVIRPTDAAMLLVPLFWGEFSKESSKAKWQMLKANIKHLPLAMLGGILAVLPQLIYWKYATGSWVYNVGSKWHFLNPHWRVLIGFEKGWFIYTPITLFFVIGLFFIRNKPFKRAVTVFFIINTWIIIAWADWRYGGTYSCRALMQSYAILILPLAAAVEWALNSKWKFVFIAIWTYCIGVNIFQLYQYNKQIILYDGMNWKYYSAVYLNPSPTPLDMSLIDTEDWIDASDYTSKNIFTLRDTSLGFDGGKLVIAHVPLQQIPANSYLKITLDGVTQEGLWQSYFVSSVDGKDSTYERKIRLFNNLNKEKVSTRVSYYHKLPEALASNALTLSIVSDMRHQTQLKWLTVELFTEKK
jgi:hypothetical protein